ncbi:MAG: hypothetical protein ACWA5T_04525 [Parvularcula sp.]
MIFKLLSRPKKKKHQPVRGRASSQSFLQEFQAREAARTEERLKKESSRHSHERQDERASCFSVAELRFPETGGRLDGVLLDASRNGVTFRPAAHYIQVLDGEQILLVCQDEERVGVIRSTRPDGYGIQIFDPFTDEDLKRIYDESLTLDDDASEFA